MKKFIVLVTVAAMCLSISACSNKKEKVSENETPTVTWNMMFQDQKGLEAVENEINNKIGEELGAKLDIKRIDPASYNEKLQVMFASQEVFDLCWMAPNAGYYTYAAKGALLPLNDLIKKYAPKSYAQIPEELWNAGRISGELYGFINYQIVGRQYGYVMQKDMIEESGFDTSTINNFEDIEPLLKYITENHDDYIAAGIFGSAPYKNLLSSYGITCVDNVACGIEESDEKLKVFNIYERPEYLELCRLMRDWYNKGYIEKDAATITNGVELRKTGVIKTWWDMTDPGFEATYEQGCGGRPVEIKPVVPAFITSDNVIATMNSISATSEHPEKAMQLLEMVNTNYKNIYNNLCFGIEDTHYKKVGENRIELIEGSDYYPNIAWAWGNQFNAYLMPGQPDDVWEQTKQINATAERSRLLGFCFDSEAVKSQLSQVTAVVKEYNAILGTGSVEPETRYDEFIKRMKSAGVDDIINEAQRQIDEWVASK